MPKRPQELTDDFLHDTASGKAAEAALAAAKPADPHRMFKESGARQRDAILSIVRERPMPSANIDEARQAACDLEARLEDAKAAHWRTFRGATFSQHAQQSAQSLARLEQEFHFARDHVRHLQLAHNDRVARGYVPPDPPEAA